MLDFQVEEILVDATVFASSLPRFLKNWEQMAIYRRYDAAQEKLDRRIPVAPMGGTVQYDMDGD